ncbi:MAG: mannose-6-phosphate isomerase, class I, partial [Treponema sp.]|nr:mannose-6-phosphate isomerase, class I [Treponema sp.]
MAEVFKLLNKVKHYPWGSVSLIPQFLGREENTEPWAEIWMGAYPGFSSQAELAGGECGLDELIVKNPIHYLGEKAARKYGILPFLFKVLAPDKPMSIQAHPSMAQAKEGFARENAAALPLYAHNRNYKDANHKPEILCAIAHNGRNLPFIGLCGFRNPQEIHSLLSAFLETDAAAPYYGNLQKNFITLLQALKIPDPSSALKAFFIALFNLSPQEREILTTNALSLNTLCAISKKNSSLLSSDGDEIQLIQNFAALYPGDPAVISPLYLNVFRLEQGEAIFLEAGILHAYCCGFGIELMANSDNILRGGLTNKYIDVPELINILDFNPYIPKII